MAANLKLLSPWLGSEAESRECDCVIYVYVPRSDLIFWTSAELPLVTSLCELVEVPGQRFSQNLFMVQPALLKHFRFIFVLLDDILLSPDFDLRQFLSIMDRNRLSVASPRVIGANTGGGQKFRMIMQAPPPNGSSVGYRTTFLEIFACVYTPSAYRALWSLLLPSVNPFGWGYDLWYDGFARRRVRGHAMGIVSVFTASHQQDSAVSVRADNTSVKEKWQAAMRQEKYFEDFLNIPLRRYRLKMRIRGKDWDGAMTGYLK